MSVPILLLLLSTDPTVQDRKTIPCPGCGGEGAIETPCPQCGGDGVVDADCPYCTGGRIPCDFCRADGSCDDRDCSACGGTGLTDCYSCGGTGMITPPCGFCLGEGIVRTACPSCSGAGSVPAPADATSTVKTGRWAPGGT